jgi:leader peptidase (prepilin peptidase)/N-methyltransferase
MAAGLLVGLFSGKLASAVASRIPEADTARGRNAWRDGLVALCTGFLFAGTAAKFGPSLDALVFAAFFWVLVVLTLVDLEHRLLPNRIVYPAAVAGWTVIVLDALAAADVARLKDAATGALVFGGFILGVAFIYPAGMGGGDVKLGFVLGTFVGYAGGLGAVVVAMFAAFVVGGVGGVVVMVVTGGGRRTKIPFGPFLALGGIIGIFAGQIVADAYLAAL